ncbi:MAG: hypothetical protein JST19_23225 [Bacteroidetes bacterium]|nr:hypothetical protein [Bacteroidota bacterium]
MATIIDRAQAQNLIQQFQAENSAAGGPNLLTTDGNFLNGFFVDADCVNAIMASDPNIAGIHVYFAKHPLYDGQPGRYYTIMIMGSEINTAPGAATPYVSNGDVFDTNPPCPPYCCNLG